MSGSAPFRQEMTPTVSADMMLYSAWEVGAGNWALSSHNEMLHSCHTPTTPLPHPHLLLQVNSYSEKDVQQL